MGGMSGTIRNKQSQACEIFLQACDCYKFFLITILHLLHHNNSYSYPYW